MRFRSTFLNIIILVISVALKAGTTYGQTGVDNKPDEIPNCDCPKIEYINSGLPFYNSLGVRIKANTIFDMSSWLLTGQKFETLFFGYYQYSGDDSNFSCGLSVLSPKAPIKFIHPDKTFTLNFTPCKNAQGKYELPLTIDFEHRILRELRDFDFTKFDYTTQAYVDLLLALSHKRPDEMIRIALKAQMQYSDGLGMRNRAVSAINSNFNAGIPLFTEKKFRDTATISEIMDSLVSKKLRQARVLTSAFILSEPGVHRINAIEEDRVTNLFYRYCRSLTSFKEFEKGMIRPVIHLDLESTKANVEISSAIMQPATTDRTEHVTTVGIRADLKSANYTSYEGLQMKFARVCIPSAVIAGTQIQIDFVAAQLLASTSQSAAQLDYSRYPQFAQNKKRKLDTAKVIQYDSLLTHFTGLFVKDARLTALSGNDTLRFTASDLIVNDFLIAGTIAFKLASSHSRAVFADQTGVSSQLISISRLLSIFKKNGLRVFLTSNSDGQFRIHFKKLLPAEN